MATVRVRRTDGETFEVDVREGATHTHHRVRANAEQLRRYGGEADPERLLQASFEFLLEREPAEAILSEFELPVIERYFPEYPRAIRSRIA